MLAYNASMNVRRPFCIARLTHLCQRSPGTKHRRVPCPVSVYHVGERDLCLWPRARNSQLHGMVHVEHSAHDCRPPLCQLDRHHSTLLRVRHRRLFSSSHIGCHTLSAQHLPHSTRPPLSPVLDLCSQLLNSYPLVSSLARQRSVSCRLRVHIVGPPTAHECPPVARCCSWVRATLC